MYRHSNNYTACYLYAIREGISLKYWDNRVPDIYPDQSEEKFRLVVEDLEDVLKNKIIKDDKWKVDDIKSNQRLCLHHYYRDVRTCEILSKDEIQNFIRYLKLRNCPGIGVRYSVRQQKPDRYLYTFETSVDSSD